MNIKKIAPYLTGKVENPKEPATKVSGEDKPAPSSGASTDRVELSKDYKGLVQAKKAMSAGSEIRAEKVEVIRDQLETGTYEVKPEEIAGKMLEEVFA